MLGTIVLLLVVAAAAVVASILFVLFGPVPVNRKVVMVSPIQPMPSAAAAIMMEPVLRPQVFADGSASFAPTPTDIAVAAAIAPPPIAPPTPAARPRKITPVERGAAEFAARTPRGEAPPPLPRTRAARGTHGRPNQVFDSVEVTARQTPAFDADERTQLDEAALS